MMDEKIRLCFAPMEGLTDGILRRTHREFFGCVDLYGLPFDKLNQNGTLSMKERRDLSREENEGVPVLPQALTKSSGQLIAWLTMLKEMGYECADLNLGCPSPTVTRKGRGSALLSDPDALGDFLDEVFDRLPLPLSCKTRIGTNSPDEWEEILPVLSRYPFRHVCIHVRTAREMYTPVTHPQAFSQALSRLTVPAFYNGDLFSPLDAERILGANPGCAGLMLGRGLLMDPALARRLRGGEAASREELSAYYQTLGERWQARFGLTIALGRLKKLLSFSAERDLSLRRLLRRSQSIGDCVRASLLLSEH